MSELVPRTEKQKLSIAEEVRIVAYIAQGNTYSKTRQLIMDDFGFAPTENTIGNVVKRNKENLDMIKETLLKREEADALAIKQTANKMISKKLKRTEDNHKVVEKARKDYLDGVITFKEYVAIKKSHREATLGELVNVSKAMHDQTKEEPPAPVAKQDMAELIAAIKSGDEVKVSQIIFNGGGSVKG